MGACTIAFFYSRRNSRATKYSPRKTSQVPVCDHGKPPHAFAPIPPRPSPHREGAFLLLLLLPWYTQVSRARRGGSTVAAGKGHNTRRPRKPHTTFPPPPPTTLCCTRASSSSPSSLTPRTVTQRPPGPAASPPHTGCERAHTGERSNTLTCRRRAKNLRRAGGGKKRTREARGTDQLTDRPPIHQPAVPITSA